MFGPHTPGTLVVLAGAILFTLVTLSTPILKQFYFLSVDVQASVASVPLNGNLKLGVFGYCIVLGSQSACSPVTLGYSLNPDQLLSLPQQTNLGISTTVLEKLTYVLILHPIAAGLAILAVISAALSHMREFSRTCWTSFFASLATTIALIAFAFDIIAFSIAKSKIVDATTNSLGTNAHLGIAVWLTLAGWISLASSSCFFCVGRCLIRKRHKRQREADRLRPLADQAFAGQMRYHATEAEKAREAQKMKQHVQPTSSGGLPAFAEYGNEHVRHEEIPLNRFDGDEEQYSDHYSLLHPPPPGSFLSSASNTDSLTGVGVGYGRRAGPPSRAPTRDDQSQSHASLYSQPSFSHHHPSQSRRQVYPSPEQYSQPQPQPTSYFPPQPEPDSRSRQASDHHPGHYQAPHSRRSPPRPVYTQEQLPDQNAWTDDQFYKSPARPELYPTHARSIEYMPPPPSERPSRVLPLPGESRSWSSHEGSQADFVNTNANVNSHIQNHDGWRSDQGQFVEEPEQLVEDYGVHSPSSRRPSTHEQQTQSTIYSNYSIPQSINNSYLSPPPSQMNHSNQSSNSQNNYVGPESGSRRLESEGDVYGGLSSSAVSSPPRRLPLPPVPPVPRIFMDYKPPNSSATPPPDYQ
ncbi:hypothetical protein CROQUDRAFT_670687 [Cronartium quercuum f. sp. fusiforme G11]|uniref:Pali-domain-containing protein n=1 Tax=Cronartium quercuum f. sp. fusiforme G11 TaxID=708437 RepID=A0A9P6NP92_9BASI|nr:hypothetical protein CROQUDRAFT_670687 [Cronartium quercuum f. sp. fusiforme G11]